MHVLVTAPTRAFSDEVPEFTCRCFGLATRNLHLLPTLGFPAVDSLLAAALGEDQEVLWITSGMALVLSVNHEP